LFELSGSDNKEEIERKSLEERHEIACLRQRIVNEIQTDICIQEGIQIIDPLPLFDEELKRGEELFYDTLHKTCYAESILAWFVYESLKDKLIEVIKAKNISLN